MKFCMLIVSAARAMPVLRPPGTWLLMSARTGFASLYLDLDLVDSPGACLQTTFSEDHDEASRVRMNSLTCDKVIPAWFPCHWVGVRHSPQASNHAEGEQISLAPGQLASAIQSSLRHIESYIVLASLAFQQLGEEVGELLLGLGAYRSHLSTTANTQRILFCFIPEAYRLLTIPKLYFFT